MARFLALGAQTLAPVLQTSLPPAPLTRSPLLAFAIGVAAHAAGYGPDTMVFALCAIRAARDWVDEDFKAHLLHLLRQMHAGQHYSDQRAAIALTHALAVAPARALFASRGAHVVQVEAIGRQMGWSVSGKALDTVMNLLLTGSQLPARKLLSGMLQREGVEQWRAPAGLLQASVDWQLDAMRALESRIRRAIPLISPRVAEHAKAVLRAAAGDQRAMGLMDLLTDLAVEFEPALREAAASSANRELGQRVLADMDAHAASCEQRIAAAAGEVERRARAAHAVPGVPARAALTLMYSMGTRKGKLTVAKFHGDSQAFKGEAALVLARRAAAQDFGPAVRPAFRRHRRWRMRG